MKEGHALEPSFQAALDNLPEDCTDTMFVALLGALLVHRGSKQMWSDDKYKAEVWRFGFTVGEISANPAVTLPFMFPTTTHNYSN
jgi:hypothetical protein